MKIRSRVGLSLALLLAVLLLSGGIVFSIADDEQGDQPADKSADKPAAPQETAADPYAVPDGDAEELIQFINAMRERRPEGTTQEEMIADFTKMQTALNQAADKLLDMDIDAQTRLAALSAKTASLMMLARLGNEDVGPQLEALVEPVRKAIEQGPKDIEHFRLLFTLAQTLEQTGATKQAADLYRTGGKLFAESEDKAVAQYAEKLDGLARQLELVGQPMEITGTLLDGSTFDWDDYDGKVVLVDFWATWCGPCKAELPNVLENYEKYHDRGFEVVAISLDEDREVVENFVAEEKLPWATLFSDDPDANGWNHPMATHYGVMAIPTVILVGQDGNVVSLQARGEALGKLLEQLLGPADAAPGADN